jgi:F0F1-type ATP synthase assembly protein I
MKHLFLDVSVCAVNAVSERTNELMRGESIKVLLSLLYAIVTYGSASPMQSLIKARAACLFPRFDTSVE